MLTEFPTMPSLYMNQKLRFDIKDDFDILDENEKVAFKIKGKIVSWGDDLSIQGVEGNELAHVKQSTGSVMTGAIGVGHKYIVTKDDSKEWGSIKKTSIPLSSTKKMTAKFNDETGEVSITGGLLAMEYEFQRGGTPIAKVQKKYIALLDRYAIDFSDEEDKLAMACMLVCIDQCFKDDY